MTLELEEKYSISIQSVRCRFSFRGERWVQTGSLFTRARSIKDFDTKNLRLLCNAVFARANCSGNVGAVAVSISVISIISEILEELGSALEFLIVEMVLALAALSIASINVSNSGSHMHTGWLSSTPVSITKAHVPAPALLSYV